MKMNEKKILIRGLVKLFEAEETLSHIPGNYKWDEEKEDYVDLPNPEYLVAIQDKVNGALRKTLNALKAETRKKGSTE